MYSYFFQRRYTNGQQAHEKMLKSLIIRELQIKTQSDITSHLSEWLSPKKTKTKKQKPQDVTSIGKNVKKGNPCELLVGI